MRAYTLGIFPMAENADAKDLHWFDPPIRALLPLDQRFHVPHRLVRTLKKAPYKITLNRAFRDVMRGCAEPREGRPDTWINAELIKLYTSLHYCGNAHSIEIWKDKKLVGGLYGVAIGGAFFGESMFSRERDASKIALVCLVGLLRKHNFTLLDTQFQTPHLERFGAFEVARQAYQRMLADAIKVRTLPFPHYPPWNALLGDVLSLQPITQIS